jgi:hypothetical protein
MFTRPGTTYSFAQRQCEHAEEFNIDGNHGECYSYSYKKPLHRLPSFRLLILLAFSLPSGRWPRLVYSVG